jgi:uncharacterized repeat protein (TIGR01451 family)
MKRTLVSLFVMSSLVGASSLGVYYAQQRLAPPATDEPSGDEPGMLSRDLTPVPIPIAGGGQPAISSPGAGNPFVATTAANEAVVEDRYQAADNYQAADDVGYVADTSVEEPPRTIADDPTAGEIPDADQVAVEEHPQANAYPADEVEPRAASRFAQPVAAEMVEEAEPDALEPTPADPTRDEPRQLTPTAAQPSDRYAQPTPAGNPLRGAGMAPTPAATPGNNPTPTAERYAEEEFPPQTTGNAAPRRYPSPVAAGGPLGDQAESFDQGAAGEGTGRPGNPALSGSQSPALTIEKIAPPEIQLGKPTKFMIKVRNAGSAAAQGVEIHDTVPQGTQLLNTAPPAKAGADGALVWELGAMKPGEEKTVELELLPTSEGEIGSVATVHFHAEASVRTLATKPMLNIEVFGPAKVNKDEPVQLHIKISNPGSGAATDVVLTENVPQGLSHAEGKELQLDIGTLKPGESRELDLTLTAVEAGMVNNVVTAEAEGKLHAESQTEIEVVAPLLQVAMTGPKRRYLERNATHSISVSNPGTAAARDIDLVAVLPRTLKFVEANNGGQFDEASHAVYWSLEELPPQETGTVKLTTLPLEAGEAKVLIKSSSKAGLKAEREEIVAIEGLAAINFQLSDLKDPIEVGAETAYEIRVTNQGTKAASNVRLAVIVPRGMQPLSAEGPVRYKIEGQHVVFEPVRQLAPKADTAFTVKVKAIEPGDQRVEVQVATDEIRDPISKEESTRVYGDE